MKKLFLFTVLLLAFAATAYSQEVKLDFRASGFLDMTTMLYQWNNFYGQESVGIMNVIAPNDQPPRFSSTGAQIQGGSWNRTASYVQSRGRLKFDAIMGKELAGTIFFEMDSETWGDASSGSYQMRNRIGYFQGDRAGVEVKNLYFDVALPANIPVPMTARFGLQPFGIRSNLFMYSDATGITVSAKADPVQIIGYWVKAMEGRTATYDDVDGYGLALNAKVDSFTLGGYGWYWRYQTYPLNNSSSSLFDPSTGYGVINNPNRGPMWWFGAYADGKLGPVNINFDFIYDTGNIKNKVDPAVQKVDFTGWATRIKVDYPWEAFNFGFVGVYGSGGDANKQSVNGIPGEPVANPLYAEAGVRASKVGSYVVPVQSETGADDSEVLLASYITAGFSGYGYSQSNTTLTRGTYGGLWFAKLYGSYKASPEFKITLQGLYFGDTTKNGDTFGRALNLYNGGLKNSSNIGWEIDVINEWQVYRNLVFRFGGGLLIPGSALEFTKWSVDGIPIGSEKPNTPWIFATRLIYSF